MELCFFYETQVSQQKCGMSTGERMSAVSKAFAILEAVAAAGSSGLPFMSIIEKTRIPKASAHRLLAELVDLAVLSLDPTTRNYRGGMALARLGSSVSIDYDLRSMARPYLAALHEHTGHVATLGVRNDDEGIYIDKIEPDDFRIRLHSDIGKAFPLHCTGMGKVLLAHASAEDVRRIAKRRLPSFTKHTITDAKALRAELKQIRKNGYALDREEITRGLMCVAAPIFDADGEVAGAISCTFPSYVDSDRGIDPEVTAVVKYANAASGRRAD